MASDLDTETLFSIAKPLCNKQQTTIMPSTTSSFSIGTIPTQVEAHFSVALTIRNEKIFKESKLKYIKCIIGIEPSKATLQVSDEYGNCIFSADAVFFYILKIKYFLFAKNKSFFKF